MTFKIEELIFDSDNDSEQEQLRTRNIFETLIRNAKSNVILTEHEKNFLFDGLMLSIRNDGRPADFKQCDNPIFKWLYLIYFEDLTGGTKYYKPKGTKLYEVSIPEAQSDLKYLLEKAEEWENIITQKSSEELLLQIIFETKRELKNLENQPEFKNDPYYSGRFHFLYKKWGILLRYKWHYHMSQEIFETYNNQPILLTIGGQAVEFNEYSLVHILSRHFSQISTQYNTGKSFHKKNEFMPRILGKQLQEIFTSISVQYGLKRIDKILFKANDIIYALWIKEKSKFIKGKGEIKYNRVESLYPLEDANELIKLQSEYVEIAIDDKISIFEERGRI